MAQSVSNDALWEKLLEIDKRLEKIATTQKSLIPEDNQSAIKVDFGAIKDEIIAEIKSDIRVLGLSSDSHFKANRKNMEMLDENLRKVWNIVIRIRKQQREAAELQKSDGSYFNFSFFKVRKSFLVTTVLGLLVCILTLFCMKQQNDYALLMNESYRQSIVIEEIQAEVDSLRGTVQKSELVKKRQ